MPSCFVEHCKSSWKPNDSYNIMHSFPRDRNMIKEWLGCIPNQSLNLDQTVEKIFASKQGKYRICSKHFSVDSYEVLKGSQRLKKEPFQQFLYCHCALTVWKTRNSPTILIKAMDLAKT